MASLIKNQILKHLSKFAKNLTVDQISVEVLKGKGALQNIELNEVVLTDVLELPAWLRVQKATCNQIAIKIPWTSLKTLPVKLYIDEIRVEVVMSSDLRQQKNTDSPSAAYSTDFTSYNFANRVVEGISLYINTVEVFFTSDKFGGSFMLSRLCLESRTPTWKEAADLHLTRIRDPRLQQVLVFKQVSWQLLRIEASSISATTGHLDEGSTDRQSPSGSHNINAPLRLLTNQGRCRITMKKSTVDGSVIAGRLQLILGDILWVATLPQVRSAIYFYSYVMELVQKSAGQSKVQKAEKSLQQADLARASGVTARLTLPQQARGGPNANEAFLHYDVVETSYHFYGARIDLHICDEPVEATGPEKTGDSSNDGALQLTLKTLSFDFYPYHLAARDRSSWIYYKDRTCSEWVLSSLNSYYKLFLSKLNAQARDEFRVEWPKLMAQCCVIRLDDISIHCLTRASDKGASEKLFCGDREVLKLPDDMPVLHAEFSDYYYASERCQHLPVPPGNTLAQWNPVRIFLDYKTLRWISHIYLDVCNALKLKSSSFDDLLHRDVHVTALMPRLIIPTEASTLSDHYKSSSLNDPRPNCLVVQAANIVVDNTLLGDSVRSNDSLRRYISQLETFPLFGGNENDAFTAGNVKLASLPINTEAFHNYVTNLCEMEQAQSKLSTTSAGISQTSNILKEKSFSSITAADDLWCISLSPLWIDFTGPNTNRYPRPMPFVSDVPITMWIVPNLQPSSTSASENSNAAMLTILVRPEGALKLLLDRDQYSFLSQVAVDLNRLLQTLLKDAKKVADGMATNTDNNDNSMTDVSLSISCLISAADLSFLLPPTNGTLEVEVGNSDPGISRSSSDVSSSVRGGNVLFATPRGPVTSNSDADQSRLRSQVQSDDGFVTGSFTPDFEAASIDIAIGSTLPDDAISVITDISDMDDDNFVQIESPDISPFDDMYRYQESQRRIQSNASGNRKVMEAVDAYQEETERLCDHNRTTALIDLTTRLLQRKVSIFTLRLRRCQLGFCFAGEESRLTLLCPTVDSEEHCDIALEEAHKLLNAKAPINLDKPYDASFPAIFDDYPVVLRSGARTAEDVPYLALDLRSLKLSLRNENLTHLSDFLQEEPVQMGGILNEPPIIKLKLHVTDSTIFVTYPNVVEPIRLMLDNVWVLRMEEKDLRPSSGENVRIAELERENAKLLEQLNEAKAVIAKLNKDDLNVSK